MNKRIGNKGHNESSGYVFAPYIKMMEFNLPLTLIGFDENKKPIFRKYEQELKKG